MGKCAFWNTDVYEVIDCCKETETGVKCPVSDYCDCNNKINEAVIDCICKALQAEKEAREKMFGVMS